VLAGVLGEQGYVLREGLPHLVAVLPIDTNPRECYTTESCHEASAHPGDHNGARPKPFTVMVVAL
jgi:hypothetical protein